MRFFLFFLREKTPTILQLAIRVVGMNCANYMQLLAKNSFALGLQSVLNRGIRIGTTSKLFDHEPACFCTLQKVLIPEHHSLSVSVCFNFLFIFLFFVFVKHL